VRAGDAPDRLRGVIEGLAWDVGDGVPLMLALLAEVTGQTPVPQWLDGVFDIVPLTPWAEAARPAIDPDTAQLTQEDPVLASWLRHASTARLRAVAGFAARQALTAAAVVDDPIVRHVLADDPPRPSAELDERCRQAHAAQQRASDPRRPDLRARIYALEALQAATVADPLAAAFEAVTAASTCLNIHGGHAEDLRATVIRLLGSPPAPSGSLGMRAAPGNSLRERHRWVSAHWLGPRGTVVLARTRELDRFARAFNADLNPTHKGIPTLSGEQILALHTGGDWTTAVGLNLPVGALSVQARALSAPGEDAAMATWQAGGRIQLWYVRDGRILVYLDPQRPEQLAGEQTSLLDSCLADLPLPIPGATVVDYIPIALGLLERLTGHDLDPATLDQPHLLLDVPAWRPTKN
jgi:hypothetical protein